MLKKQLKNALRTYEELYTVFLQVERIVNNRPITYVYPTDTESCVTPNHLVFGCRLECESMSETQHYENSSLDINTEVQKIQSAIKHFWSRIPFRTT